jgi:two-component system cell cycle sensor histidine kinase/response regulator CckA
MSTSHGDASVTSVPADQSLVEALASPVFIVQHQRFAYVNPAFARLMGVERAALMGRDSLEYVHPDDRVALRQWHGTMTDGSRSESVFPVRVRLASGDERSVLITTSRIVYGAHPAILGGVMDITGRPEAMATPVRLAAVGRLAGGVARDFNNLLLVIGGQVERLQQELPVGHDSRHAVDAIATAAERAATLTDQLLSFGRRQMLSPQVMDLAALVGDLEPGLRSRLGGDITLRIAASDGLPPIRADRPRLMQAVRHLVDNARDAMPSGGTLTVAVDVVQISADLEAHWPFLESGTRFVRLRVSDSGGGIEAAALPHIFEPFFTTKGRGRGSGMGLASVYGIVKQSRGYVFVERTGAEGTCMTILLPPAEWHEDAEALAAGAAAAAAPSRRARVLLVEDEMAVRELLEEMLERSGFDVASAETGEQATLIASEQAFDVLLTDIDLPGMNGAQLSATLHRQLPHLAVVLMSGYPEDGALEQAHPEERRVLLRKPFSTQQLVARLREALSFRN